MQPSNDAILKAQLEAAGAVFGPAEPAAEPLHFGDFAGEYEALASGAGLVDFRARTRIEFTGDDRASFVHNLCTNEVRKLTPGTGCEAFLADARGHLLAHVFLFCRASSLLLETVANQEAKLLAHFDRYLIREKVQLAGRSEADAEFLLAGPRAAEILPNLIGAEPPSQRLHHVEAELAGCRALVARVEMTRAGGYLIFCQRPDGAAVWRALNAAGARPCGLQAWEAARIEAGFPCYGIDLNDKNLPQEAARDALAISFVKGCYLGQETVARIDALGHVNKSLVGVKFSEASVPEPGLELTSGGQSVGNVTSACFSPRLNAPFALAYVRRGLTEPGTMLESSLGGAEVTSLPAP